MRDDDEEEEGPDAAYRKEAEAFRAREGPEGAFESGALSHREPPPPRRRARSKS